MKYNNTGFSNEKHTNMDLLHAALRERILILDGAMGTMLQAQGLTEEDFRRHHFTSFRKDLKGNNDVLCMTCPEAVLKVHNAYLEAGADIIETNTFNSNAVSQEEYGLQDLVYELNKAGAAVARKAADACTRLNPANRVSWRGPWVRPDAPPPCRRTSTILPCAISRR